jgi:hypothetical protein
MNTDEPKENFTFTRADAWAILRLCEEAKLEQQGSRFRVVTLSLASSARTMLPVVIKRLFEAEERLVEIHQILTRQMAEPGDRGADGGAMVKALTLAERWLEEWRGPEVEHERTHADG